MFYGLEDAFSSEKAEKPMKIVAFLCGVSYEYYLIHHVVIDQLTARCRNIPFSNGQILLLFGAEVLVTAALTALLKLLLSLPRRIRK